jgi:protein-S-isoprenylcysteine O-methyltransferase Ste14
MIGPDIIFRHVVAFLVPCGFAFIVFLASRATEFFWARLTGVVLALLTFYFSMMIMNRLLFARPHVDEAEGEAKLREPPDDAGG